MVGRGRKEGAERRVQKGGGKIVGGKEGESRGRERMNV